MPDGAKTTAKGPASEIPGAPQAPTTAARRGGFWALLRRTFPVALPVMLGYLVIGVPSGILEAEIGLAPWQAFAISATFYTGAGQFMLSNLWLAGQSLAAIATSISLVNTRQLLYSAAFAPRFAKVPKAVTALFAATVTDESFGVNTERFENDPAWTAVDAIAVNLLAMLSWSTANAVGAAVGDLLALPTDVASFAMTAIFVCLFLTQVFTPSTVLCAAVAVAVVVTCKFVGLGSVAVLAGAVAAVAVTAVFDHLRGANAEPAGDAAPDAAALEDKPDRAEEAF